MLMLEQKTQEGRETEGGKVGVYLPEGQNRVPSAPRFERASLLKELAFEKQVMSRLRRQSPTSHHWQGVQTSSS